ncbi:RNP1 [Scenedesmus sp. PABB004]|nr:RNP1 [Scenedesmus sp. PABB004]
MLSGSPDAGAVPVAGMPCPEDAAAAPAGPGQAELPRKLAVLGLPWDTSEDTLRLHFAQFGAVEATEIMKDRLSGKSRGFGFVTFADSASAARALTVDHTIDGRRCEAKVALPKNLLQGDMAPVSARTTRIFVARIPQSVTDTQFRAYFEKYGRLQDAYMPRDHSRQMYRGIGFVTFATPESVEKVMACKHWLNGHEVAIDRATPKEDGRGGHGHGGAALAGKPGGGGPGARRSFDNGAGIVGPGLTPMLNYQAQLSQLLADPMAMAASLASGMRLSEEQQREFSNAAAELATSHFNAAAAAAAAACADFNAAAAAAAAEQAACSGGSGSPLLPQTTTAMLCGLSEPGCHADGSKSPTALDGGAAAANAAAAAAAAMAAMAQGMPLPPLPGLQGLQGLLPPGMNPAAIQSLAKTAGLFPGGPMGQFPGLGGPLGGPLPGLPGGDAFASQLFGGLPGMPPPGMKAHGLPPGVGGGPGGGPRKSLDAVLHGGPGGAPGAPGRRSAENPAIQSVRAGPRIFIGKLTKDTSEADVKEYFGRFGFVMDVYMPKAKDNKTEHRGFGFVTFETDAAIKRVVGAGTHKLKGSTIAIDIAMPKLDEEGGALDGGLGGAGLGGGGGMPPLGGGGAGGAAPAAARRSAPQGSSRRSSTRWRRA